MLLLLHRRATVDKMWMSTDRAELRMTFHWFDEVLFTTDVNEAALSSVKHQQNNTSVMTTETMDMITIDINMMTIVMR